jgi:hypothetical protein
MPALSRGWIISINAPYNPGSPVCRRITVASFHNKMAKVWFVGAGPGDPELLTLKAQKLIAQADAILYAGLKPRPTADLG